jgi:hypothetical protein
MLLRPSTVAILGAVPVLAAATVAHAAHAGTISLDRSCYAAADTMVIRGSGFPPVNVLGVTGDGGLAAVAVTNLDGRFSLSVPVPDRLFRRYGASVRTRARVRVADPSDGAQRAQATYRLAGRGCRR